MSTSQYVVTAFACAATAALTLVAANQFRPDTDCTKPSTAIAKTDATHAPEHNSLAFVTARKNLWSVKPKGSIELNDATLSCLIAASGVTNATLDATGYTGTDPNGLPAGGGIAIRGFDSKDEDLRDHPSIFGPAILEITKKNQLLVTTFVDDTHSTNQTFRMTIDLASNSIAKTEGDMTSPGAQRAWAVAPRALACLAPHPAGR